MDLTLECPTGLTDPGWFIYHINMAFYTLLLFNPFVLWKGRPINFLRPALLFLRMLILVPGGTVTDWSWDSHDRVTVSNDENVSLYDLTNFRINVSCKPVAMWEVRKFINQLKGFIVAILIILTMQPADLSKLNICELP